MNNKGFTLIEIIAVIAILALLIIISVPLIGNASLNVKKKTLQTKIDNIEKAAVLYGQDNREKFTVNCTGSGKLCGSISFDKCKCFNGTVDVQTLIDEEKINADDESGNILNSVNETESLNGCKIQIYQKYGKIYAVYDTKTDKNTCWYE